MTIGLCCLELQSGKPIYIRQLQLASNAIKYFKKQELQSGKPKNIKQLQLASNAIKYIKKQELQSGKPIYIKQLQLASNANEIHQVTRIAILETNIYQTIAIGFICNYFK